MSNNQVIVTLSARDLISPQLANLRANIDSVGARARASISARDLLGMTPDQIRLLRENMRLLDPPDESQGFLGASLFGNLGAQAIAAGISLISQGVSRLQGQLLDAAKQQTTSLAQAGDLSTQLGVSFSNAKNLVADTRAEVSRMAAALPGENADYNAIFGQISATVAKGSMGDVTKFKKDALELTQSYGALASIRRIDPYQAGSVVNRLLAGTRGIGESFSQDDITQKSPLLRDYIQAQLKIIGKSEDDWKSLTLETRKNILISAGKQAVSRETLESFDGTVDSMLAIAQSTIFDQDIGIFGFLRKIKEAQGRSGLDAVQSALASLGNLFNTLGDIGKSLGITSETPMAMVIRVIDWFTDRTNELTGILNGGDLLEVIDWDGIAEDFGYSFGKSLGDFIVKIDWTKVAITVVKVMVASVESLGAALRGAFNGLIGSVGQNLNNSVSRTLQGAFGLPVGNIDVAGALQKTNELFGVDKILPANPLSIIKPLLPGNQPKDNKQAFAPQVNIQASTSDPQAIASAVMDSINNLYVQYQANSLA